MYYLFSRHYYTILLVTLFVTPSVIANEDELEVCALFQNEAPLLKEWVAFYRLMGVQNIYVGDTKSSDQKSGIQASAVKEPIGAQKAEKKGAAQAVDWRPDHCRAYYD